MKKYVLGLFIFLCIIYLSLFSQKHAVFAQQSGVENALETDGDVIDDRWYIHNIPQWVIDLIDTVGLDAIFNWLFASWHTQVVEVPNMEYFEKILCGARPYNDFSMLKQPEYYVKRTSNIRSSRTSVLCVNGQERQSQDVMYSEPVEWAREMDECSEVFRWLKIFTAPKEIGPNYEKQEQIIRADAAAGNCGTDADNGEKQVASEWTKIWCNPYLSFLGNCPTGQSARNPNNSQSSDYISYEERFDVAPQTGNLSRVMNEQMMDNEPVSDEEKVRNQRGGLVGYLVDHVFDPDSQVVNGKKENSYSIPSETHDTNSTFNKTDQLATAMNINLCAATFHGLQYNLPLTAERCYYPKNTKPVVPAMKITPTPTPAPTTTM